MSGGSNSADKSPPSAIRLALWCQPLLDKTKMQMATLSRWTLAYFAVALMGLVLALALLALGYGYPEGTLGAPATLVVVHLVTIGWLSMLMLGALFQFLPVLVGRDLEWPWLAPWALGILLAGLLALLAGFVALDGYAGLPTDLLPIGGTLLLVGFVLATAMLVRTLLRANDLPLPASFVALGVLSLLLTATLGETLASTLAGWIGGDFSVALVTHGVALHAGFGLGGWLTVAAVGVSYRLTSMFMIAPESTGRRPRLVLAGAILALALLCGVLGMLMATNTSWPIGLALAGLAAIIAIGAYLGDIVATYRKRRRQALELHMQAAIAAFAMLPLGAGLLLLANLFDRQSALAAAFYALSLGWLGGLGLAMMYKIIPFLTWLECFAPFMGREMTPRVQDIVRETRARYVFVLYFVGTAGATLGLLIDAPALFRLAVLAQLSALALLIRQFYRARRLADLPEPWHDHARPRLLVGANRKRRLT